MATNIAEFISVLRRIRDEIYPKVEVTYENALVLKAAIEAGQIQLDEDLTSFGADFATFVSKSRTIDENTALSTANSANAIAAASSATTSASTATLRANEIKSISTQAVTLTHGSSATSSYNPADGKFTFGIPAGAKGDKGENFTINAIGSTAGRATYDAQATGFSYLDIELSQIYFKLSSASGNWSAGSPFGKGDKGDKGKEGTGIYEITFVSSTHSSGLASQPGGYDTYRITLTNANTFDYIIRNGEDIDNNLLVHKAQDETISGKKTFTSDIIGNATTANKLKTARNINLIGGVSGTGSFDGSGNLDIATTINVTSFQTGMILLWSGSTASIPSGWVLCNGYNNTPNLTNRFIIGAGSSYAVGATGGSADAVVVAHSHTASTSSDGTHAHGVTAAYKNEALGLSAGGFGANNASLSTTWAGAHAHTVYVSSTGVSGTGANIPPYYALAYIMKT